VNQPENWKYSESVLREVLQEMKVKFVEADDEAAFYGPKVDVQFKSIVGREETMSTIQLDFVAKERFGFKYTDETGKENTEVFVIHRAPLSTHERFIAFLIEHYAGIWPVWLSPVQVLMAPVGEKHVEGAMLLVKEMFNAGIRAEMDSSNESIGKKVRNGAKRKIPYIVVVGDKELSGNEPWTVRVRGQEEQIKTSKEEFVAKVLAEIRERK
jgi:threonyl-tRNA synthetase